MKKRHPELDRRLGRMLDCNVLDDRRRPRLANSMKEWATFLSSPDCVVASTDIGEVNVTTAFTGIDLGYATFGPPMLFATMIFGGQYDGVGALAATWEVAEIVHEERCNMLRNTGSRKKAA